MRRFLGLLATLAAVSALLALAAGQAMGATVHCGDVITQDTTLDSDLIDCPGNGLVIDADDITLDLNGHTIEGASSPGSGVDDQRIGAAAHPHDSVTVKNGVIRGFSTGVGLYLASHYELRGLTVSGQQAIHLESNSDENLIERNLLAGRIELVDSNHNLVRRNVVSNGGLYVIGGFNEVRENSISGGGAGIAVFDSTGNALIRNRVFENGVGITATSSAANTRVEGNFAYRNAGDGIVIACCGSLAVGNVANANGDDGIDAEYAGDEPSPDVVTRNTANRNADFGIEAIPGVVDGGGNRAKHNGNPLQCVNIFCKTNGPKK